MWGGGQRRFAAAVFLSDGEERGCLVRFVSISCPYHVCISLCLDFKIDQSENGKPLEESDHNFVSYTSVVLEKSN